MLTPALPGPGFRAVHRASRKRQSRPIRASIPFVAPCGAWRLTHIPTARCGCMGHPSQAVDMWTAPIGRHGDGHADQVAPGCHQSGHCARLVTDPAGAGGKFVTNAARAHFLGDRPARSRRPRCHQCAAFGSTSSPAARVQFAGHSPALLGVHVRIRLRRRLNKQPLR